MGPGSVGATASKTARRAGLITMLAGAGFALGGGLSTLGEWTWVLFLAGIVLLLYAVPQLHKLQAPADGAVGQWGTRLFVLGAGILVALGAVFLVWDAFGDPGEPAWTEALWPVGFVSFLLGFVLFVAGSLKARVLESLGLWLIVVGLIGGVALDMATGAFFADEGEVTEWGFIIGIPLAGLGLLLVGYRLWSQKALSEAS